MRKKIGNFLSVMLNQQKLTSIAVSVHLHVQHTLQLSTEVVVVFGGKGYLSQSLLRLVFSSISICFSSSSKCG